MKKLICIESNIAIAYGIFSICKSENETITDKLYDLRVDNLITHIGVDNNVPRFSWNV